jgi:ketosteroid isomerase-like protein
MASPARRVVAAVLVLVVAFVFWQFWPSETRKIRRKLDALAAVVNERPVDGLTQVARTARLAQFFTEDVVVEPGRGAGPIHGRERLIALASRAPTDEAFRLAFVDISISIDGDASATAHLTATASSRDSETGQADVDAREVELQFRKANDWQISRIALVDTLEKPQP